MMFIAAVTLDREQQEIYTVDNDIGDRMMVFPYDAEGNRQAKARPRSAASGMGPVDQRRTEGIRGDGRGGARDRDLPKGRRRTRTAAANDSRTEDPPGRSAWHFFDGQNNELLVANHGNHGGGAPTPGDAPARQRGTRIADSRAIAGGRFDGPSITVYPGDAKGDVAPIARFRRQDRFELADGDRCGPGIRNEIAVANDGDSSVGSSAAPTQVMSPRAVIKGPRTGINGPMGVAYDLKNNEIWVANYGEHTALVFPSHRDRQRAPKRILRNAPAGSPTVASEILELSRTTRSGTKSWCPIESANRESRRCQVGNGNADPDSSDFRTAVAPQPDDARHLLRRDPR